MDADRQRCADKRQRRECRLGGSMDVPKPLEGE